jgi:hypothetical protein
MLSSLEGPLIIIAVAGFYRTGKSFLLNQLAKTQGGGFKVGSTIQSCTRGIDLLVPDLPPGRGGGRLVLMDTEGMASMDQDETYDALLFSLGLLLSSTFVLNSMGVIDEAAIDRLFLVSELTKHVCVHSMPNGGGADGSHTDEAEQELASYFPPFLWLLRDFVVELIDDTGTEISASEYLERALHPRTGSSKRVVERNQVRSSIRNLFQNRSCITFGRPASSEKGVRNANSLLPEDIRPDFHSQVNALRTRLLQVAPKSLFGENLGGRNVVDMARAIVGTMNKGDVVPSIKGAWEYVVDQSCTDARAAAFAEYQQAMTEATSTEPLPTLAGLLVSHRTAMMAAERKFMSAVIGGSSSGGAQSGGRVGLARAELESMVDTEMEKKLEELQAKSERQCSDVAVKAQARLEGVITATTQVAIRNGSSKLAHGEHDSGVGVADGDEPMTPPLPLPFAGELSGPFVACVEEYSECAQGPYREAGLLKMLTTEHGVGARQLQQWWRNTREVMERSLADAKALHRKAVAVLRNKLHKMELDNAALKGQLVMQEERCEQQEIRITEQQRAAEALERRATAELAAERERHALAAEQWKTQLGEVRGRHTEAVEELKMEAEEVKKRHAEVEAEWRKKYATRVAELEESVREEKERAKSDAEEAEAKRKEALAESQRQAEQEHEEHEATLAQEVARWTNKVEDGERKRIKMLTEERKRAERALASEKASSEEVMAKLEEAQNQVKQEKKTLADAKKMTKAFAKENEARYAKDLAKERNLLKTEKKKAAKLAQEGARLGAQLKVTKGATENAEARVAQLLKERADTAELVALGHGLRSTSARAIQRALWRWCPRRQQESLVVAAALGRVISSISGVPIFNHGGAISGEVRFRRNSNLLMKRGLISADEHERLQKVEAQVAMLTAELNQWEELQQQRDEDAEEESLLSTAVESLTAAAASALSFGTETEAKEKIRTKEDQMGEQTEKEINEGAYTSEKEISEGAYTSEKETGPEEKVWSPLGGGRQLEDEGSANGEEARGGDKEKVMEEGKEEAEESAREVREEGTNDDRQKAEGADNEGEGGEDALAASVRRVSRWFTSSSPSPSNGSRDTDELEKDKDANVETVADAGAEAVRRVSLWFTGETETDVEKEPGKEEAKESGEGTEADKGAGKEIEASADAAVVDDPDPEGGNKLEESVDGADASSGDTDAVVEPTKKTVLPEVNGGNGDEGTS